MDYEETESVEDMLEDCCRRLSEIFNNPKIRYQIEGIGQKIEYFGTGGKSLITEINVRFIICDIRSKKEEPKK